MEIILYLSIGFISGILFAMGVEMIRDKINKNIVIRKDDELWRKTKRT